MTADDVAYVVRVGEGFVKEVHGGGGCGLYWISWTLLVSSFKCSSVFNMKLTINAQLSKSG